jgi:shikimate kinase
LAGDDPAGRIRELLAERAPLYRRYPQVATEDRSPEGIVDDLLRRLKDSGAA